MNTILLDAESWDLTTSASNSIAVAANPYSLAQGAACAIMSFLGENYYNTALGVPYFQQILGKNPPISLVRAQFVAQAEAVPDVVKAKVFFSSATQRTITGQVQVIDAAGILTVANF